LTRSIHIVPSIANEASGPSYSVTRLCRALIDNAVNVDLAALDWGQVKKPPIFLKTFKRGWGPARLGNSPAMKRWLDDQVWSNHVDVVHSHGMWQMNALYPGWAANKGNVQLIISPRGSFSQWAFNHGSWTKPFFWSLLQKPAFDKVTCFHATSQEEYADIRRLGFTQPVAVIPNGIDLPAGTVDTPRSDIRTLLFLGRIHPKKGIDILLRAWRRVQGDFSGWNLCIAGSDDAYHGASGYLDEMKTVSRQLCAERVEFPGEITGAAKWKAYENADLFVLPTHSENFGMTVAEALAAGTPAIVTRGAPWAGLESQGAGWWIDTGELPLTKCLQDALSKSRDDLSAMGQCGKQWMQADFSWPKIGCKMSTTYRWLLERFSPVPEWIQLD
jgi:glycosyltransferase involved in cell wall biosynthesis